MAVLHLENVPEEMVREIEWLAQREHRTPAEKALSLLQEALNHNRKAAPPEQPPAGETVQDILDRLARNQFRPDPEGPDVVEMLREDRNR
jgi:hypothetical protein